jgi:hypothetical protein
MEKKLSGLVILFMVVMAPALMSQYVASQKGDKVEVHDINGRYVASGYYSGLKDVAQGNDIVVLWLGSNKVEVRSYDLKYIASQYYSDVKKISATGDYVVLYYENGKIEVHDKNLKYISSWYQ